MDEALGFDLKNSGFLSVLPYLAQFAMSVIGGKLADHMVSQGMSVTIVRKLFGALSHLLPAIFLILITCFDSVQVAITCVVCAVGFIGLSVAGWGANGLDIAPQYAGIIMGFSNTAGTLPGMFGVSLTGFMLQKWHSWNLVFLVAAGVYIADVLFWVPFSTGKKIL